MRNTLTDKKAITKLQVAFVVAIVLIASTISAVYYAFYMTPKPVEQGDIVIGAAIAQTGSLASAGIMQVRGYYLWEKNINEMGGLLGRHVRILLYDDGGDPTTTKTLYERLITVDKVDLLIGPYASSCALTAAPIAEKYKKILIHPCNTAMNVFNQGYEYGSFLVSQASVVEYRYDPIVASFFNNLSPVPRNVAITYVADTYPKSMGTSFNRSFSKAGYNVVMMEEFAKNTLDLSALVSKMKNLNPDAVFCIGYVPEETLFVRTCAQLGFKPKLLFTSIAATPEFKTTLGNSTVQGVTTMESFNPNYIPLTESQSFVSRYRAAYNQDPDVRAATGYSACQLLEQAIKATGKIDDESIRQYLLTHEVKTASGPWKVDQDLANIGIKYVGTPWLMTLQWQNGVLKVIWPKDISNADYVYPLT